MRAQAHPASQASREGDLFCLIVASVLAVGTMLTATVEPGNPLRWITYSVPFVALLLHLALRLRIEREHFGSAMAILLAITAAVVISIMFGGPNSRTVNDGIFWISPWLLFLLLPRPPMLAIQLIFFANIAAVFLSAIFGTEVEGGEISFSESTGIIETSFAFPIGAFFLYFLVARPKVSNRTILLAIAAVMLAVSLKRTAVLAVAAAFLLSTRPLNFLWKTPAARVRNFAIVTAVICVIALYFIDLIVFINNNVIRLYRFSPEQLLLGRYHFTQMVDTYLRFHGDVLKDTFGFGVGKFADISERIFHLKTKQLHNDFLRMQFESGLFGLVVILAALVAAFSRSKTGVIVGIYTILVFISDNIFAYVFYMYALAFILRADSGIERPPRRTAGWRPPPPRAAQMEARS